MNSIQSDIKRNAAVVSTLLKSLLLRNSFMVSSNKQTITMKHILTIAILLSTIFSASAQHDKCAPNINLVTFYYTYESHTNYGFGFEAGTQGIDSRIGGFAGFQFQRMADGYFKKDTASFKLRAALYLKGAYRINEEVEGKGSLFLVAYPSLSVQTGFDFKTGLRGALPLSERNAIGIEPAFSFRYKTASLNVMVFF